MFLTIVRLLLLLVLFRLALSFVRWIASRGKTPVGGVEDGGKKPVKRPFPGKRGEIEDADWEEIDENRRDSG